MQSSSFYASDQGDDSEDESQVPRPPKPQSRPPRVVQPPNTLPGLPFLPVRSSALASISLLEPPLVPCSSVYSFKRSPSTSLSMISPPYIKLTVSFEQPSTREVRAFSVASGPTHQSLSGSDEPGRLTDGTRHLLRGTEKPTLTRTRTRTETPEGLGRELRLVRK